MNIEQYININNIKSPYLKYAKNVYTQNGEDGIISKLMEELELKNGITVELGAHNGLFISNTYNLWKNKNFNSILIESDPNLFKDLEKNTNEFENVEIFNCLVSQEHNLESILEKSIFKINNDNFALLSIDVDSIDYYIFESMEKFLPIILIIETQTNYLPIEMITGDNGCSIGSLIELGIKKGYKAIVSTGNCFFVRNDYLHLLKEDISTITANDIYVNTNIVNNILQHLNQNGEITSDIFYLKK